MKRVFYCAVVILIIGLSIAVVSSRLDTYRLEQKVAEQERQINSLIKQKRDLVDANYELRSGLDFCANMQNEISMNVKDVREDINDLYDKYNSTTWVTQDELKILQKIVEAEATGQDVFGKLLIANVVLNRVESNRFPDNIEAVVFAPRQFSPVGDLRYYVAKPTESAVAAVDMALKGKNISKGSLFFMARSMADKRNIDWFDNDLQPVLEYSCHEFFK